MNYQQTLDYLFEKLPMYQRIGGAAYKADLHNTIELCRLLGNPENRFRSVHVAGTNGKGSTSHIISSALQEAGLKTGLYTSPHYRDFRERIKINGKMITEEQVISFVEKWKAQFEEIGLSFFEMTVGMAFDFFAREKVDIAVIEVGMGGRLDSTNVVTPLVSVITNIGMDHMRFLGNTLPEIAAEKAGIIKKGIPLVVGETQEEIKNLFIQKAEALNSPISFADKNWQVFSLENNLVEIRLNGETYLSKASFPLQGAFQQRNLISALETIRVITLGQTFEITKKDIAAGIQNVAPNTGLKGRWQVIGTHPLIICDSGHNADGIKQVVENINNTPHRRLHLVFGMVNDKSIESILKLLPGNAQYYFCKPAIPRGLDAAILAKEAQRLGLTGAVFSSVQHALETAKSAAASNDLIVVGGSTFVVAEVV
jgi:dihydrofolate synthase / folylpolyglutamate synthase